MDFNDEDLVVLEKIKSGVLDGVIGRILTTSGGSSIWTELKEGVITRIKVGPGGKFFDNRETTSYPGKRTVLGQWASDEELIEFAKQFGGFFKDSVLQKYYEKHKK